MNAGTVIPDVMATKSAGGFWPLKNGLPADKIAKQPEQETDLTGLLLRRTLDGAHVADDARPASEGADDGFMEAAQAHESVCVCSG